MTRCRRVAYGKQCVLEKGHRGPHQMVTKHGVVVRWYTKAEHKAGKRIRKL